MFIMKKYQNDICNKISNQHITVLDKTEKDL